MIDQMQLAMSGNAAKDKRQASDSKRSSKTTNKKLKADEKEANSAVNNRTPTLVIQLLLTILCHPIIIIKFPP